MNERSTEAGFTRLTEVIAQLREHCPWMGALTHESLVEYLIEETYELVEAIEQDHSAAEVAGELGDVLLQVVLHARLAEESGRFDIEDVVAGLTEKMVRRNPHVFTPDGGLRESFPATVDEIVERWHHVKRQEKPERTSVFDGIPAGLPALALAAKSVKRAGPAALPVWPPQDRPELAQDGSELDGSELAQDRPDHFQHRDRAGQPGSPLPAGEDELGDVLFEIVQHATANGLDPERALRSAVIRFQQRQRQTDRPQ